MYSLVGEDYSLKNVIEKFEFDTLMIIHRQFILGGTYKDYLSKFRNIRERIISLKQKWLKKERFLTKLLEHVFLYCPAKIALFCNEIKTYLVKK